MVALGVLTPKGASDAVNGDTLGILLGMMILAGHWIQLMADPPTVRVLPLAPIARPGALHSAQKQGKIGAQERTPLAVLRCCR